MHTKGNRKVYFLGTLIAVFAIGCGDAEREANIGPEERPDVVAQQEPNIGPEERPDAAVADLSEPREGNLTVADVMGNLERYTGQTVTIVADVEEVFGPKAFKLDEDNALAGGIDNDMLVLSSKAETLGNIDDKWLNNKVQVTGVVHQVAVVDIEREVGWDLDPTLEAELEKVKAVLVAKSVERVQK